MKNKWPILLKIIKASTYMLFLVLLTNCITKKEDVFLTEIGVCTSVSNADTLAAHGYTYIEESVGGFLMPDKSEEEFNQKLQQARDAAIPVKTCNSFIPGRLKCVGPEAVHPEILKYMETAFRRAQKAGVEYIVFGSGGSRSIPEGFPREEARRQFITLCTQMAPIAAQYNVVVVLEPLNSKECNFINSVEEGGEIVEEVNHANFRLLADIYHMLMDNEGPESIEKYGHLIQHTHIAEKEGRAAPGKHNEDFTAYFKALKNVHYEGKMSIECKWEDWEAQSPTAIAAIKSQLSILK
ncbi:MAG: sugar phosphate isomerase/epimerase [Sphingobacteriia bacterium]|nr:sugar phosphate isomerase/epimerase [Sphingobacteriia bacterium]